MKRKLITIKLTEKELNLCETAISFMTKFCLESDMFCELLNEDIQEDILKISTDYVKDLGNNLDDVGSKLHEISHKI